MALFYAANGDLAIAEKSLFLFSPTPLLALDRSHTRIPAHANEKNPTGEEVSAFKGQSTEEGLRRVGLV